MQDLICISHLRWDFVWQRPQQLLSRLGKHYRILFVEEPVTNVETEKPYLETYPGRAPAGVSITVARLIVPADSHYWIGHNDPRTQAAYEQLLQAHLAAEGYDDPVLWLYTPMAFPFVESIRPRLLIYDVMDELSAFKGAPPELVAAEKTLLEQADIVFTGGASLYRSRRRANPNTHLFPSGVDSAHFGRAHTEHFDPPHDIQKLAAPIIGYFGVIDERMDLALLDHMARAHPEWNIVMLGPVIKIDFDALPQAPNLHYPGMKDYADLPAYLSHFDVATVPFAMNESTRFLSPTKTLEYIAAHKRVVAAPIPDIVELFGDYVAIGSTPAEFTAAVERALAEPAEARLARHAAEDELLARYAWDAIADEMHSIIDKALRGVSTESSGSFLSSAQPQRV